MKNLNLIKKFALGTLISFGVVSQAVENELTTVVETEISRSSDRANILSVDLVPTLMGGGKGLGLGYQYRLGSQVGLGPYAEYYQNKDEGLFFFDDVTFSTAIAGIEAKWFLTQFGRGFYVSGAANYTQKKVKAIGTPSNAEAFTVRDDISKYGYMLNAGYSFMINRGSGMDLVLNLALNYGTGNEYIYRATNTGEFEIKSLDDGVGFVMGLGAVF